MANAIPLDSMQKKPYICLIIGMAGTLGTNLLMPWVTAFANEFPLIEPDNLSRALQCTPIVTGGEP